MHCDANDPPRRRADTAHLFHALSTPAVIVAPSRKGSPMVACSHHSMGRGSAVGPEGVTVVDTTTCCLKEVRKQGGGDSDNSNQARVRYQPQTK